MSLKEEVNNYLDYCKCQKELGDKTIRAYRTDLMQFIVFVEDAVSIPDKELLNQYLRFIHNRYKQKTVKRKIVNVKALFDYFRSRVIFCEAV